MGGTVTRSGNGDEEEGGKFAAIKETLLSTGNEVELLNESNAVIRHC